MSAIHSLSIGNPKAPLVVYGHGWGRSHHDFIPTAEACAPFAHSVLLDLPGFGSSARPKLAWDTQDYAQAVFKHIKAHYGDQPYTWVGHSFGGRIGLRLASTQESRPEQMIIVAGAGLKRKARFSEKIRAKLRGQRFKFAKRFARNEEALITLEQRFGSIDYVQSRALGLRDIFLRTIAEDQRENAAKITCPTRLIYGEKDQETPPEIGQELHRLIKNSQLVLCPEMGHIELLERGYHHIALAIKESLAS